MLAPRGQAGPRAHAVPPIGVETYEQTAVAVVPPRPDRLAQEPVDASRAPLAQAGDAGLPSEAEDPEALGWPIGRTIGLAYGEGVLWVRPLDSIAIPSEVVFVLARLDSALIERFLELLDSLPPDRFAGASIPDWTTEIGGRTWGIDPMLIHLGDIKIPTILLALLLPLQQGNYEQGVEARELARMRQEILRAAARMQGDADLKRYVRETRARKDREREKERAARVATRDTIIP